tara:strand:- start:415 stop:660 length:246 start_codon:yes stop_codon:yes gene_type:complete
MADTQKILKDFQNSIGEISQTFKGFSQQIEAISKEAEKSLNEKELEVLSDFKKDSKKLKNNDIASLIKLRDLYEQKIKDAI